MAFKEEQPAHHARKNRPYGLEFAMDELFARLLENLVGRASGPFHLRLWIQPAVALLFGIRDGMVDARLGKPPYFWSIFTGSSQRRTLLHEGWKSVAKVFTIALVLDVIYQIIALRFVFPGEAVLVAFLLAMLPYLVIRGPANRIARAISARRRH